MKNFLAILALTTSSISLCGAIQSGQAYFQTSNIDVLSGTTDDTYYPPLAAPDVKTILNRGNVNVNEQFGHRYKSSYLHHAASSGCSEIISELIAHNADIHAKDYKGRTPLHCAAAECHLEAARRLLTAGAGSQEKDNDGETPATLALENRDHKEDHNVKVAEMINTWQPDLPEYKEPEQEA